MNHDEKYDKLFELIADYVMTEDNFSDLAISTAKYCLLDSLGCAILSLNFSECVKLLGPVVPGATLTNGARVPGLEVELEPVQAAFNIGTMIRWLDFNDTWLAYEWGHPSDNIGGILAVADYLARNNIKQISMGKVLECIVKAYEIQGVLALKNAFNAVGLDHVILVKLATAAVASYLINPSKDQILRTLSLVMVDGQSLRTYRHFPNTGSRKSWAAGDATARGVRLALLASLGEMGYPSALTANVWGFNDALFKGQEIKVSRIFASYVIENILFKISYPAEFHAQTAVECAVKLHDLFQKQKHIIKNIEIMTHAAAMRIINKNGPLKNPADRDHCLQYMVAVALLTGNLIAENYEEEFAQNPEIDKIREIMILTENNQFSTDYLDEDKRSIPNAIRFIYIDGTESNWETIEYPIGHVRRRAEAIPLLLQKFKANMSYRYNNYVIDKLLKIVFEDHSFLNTSVVEFMSFLE